MLSNIWSRWVGNPFACMQLPYLSVMLPPMNNNGVNNETPVITNDPLAREQTLPSQSDDSGASPISESTATAEAPPVAPSASPGSAPDASATPPAPGSSDIGELIVKLGTPDPPTPEAVRRYLKEFLTDPRVIEKNSLLWKSMLHGFILPVRSRRRARDYEKIWNRDKDESPIKTITRSQTEKLGALLEPLGKHVIVDWAMRYGNPSIASRLEVLVTWGCERILVMPL